jgi:hypothetical protein
MKFRTPKIVLPQIIIERDITFPFKSRLPPKGTTYRNEVKNLFEVTPTITDSKRLTLKKKFSRKSYSPVRGGYEMDLFFIEGYSNPSYLFIININTRYLYAFPVQDKSANTIYTILQDFIPEHEVASIRGDGEPAFRSTILRDLYQQYGVKTSFNGSSQIYHVKLIDAVIRLIRDGFGKNIREMQDIVKMSQMVDYINNSVNRSTKVTPAEMEAYPELENVWIRHCQAINDEVKEMQKSNGLLDYQYDDILLVSIDLMKSKNKFAKRRRCFNELGVFQQYLNGNVVVHLLDADLSTIEILVQVPIYFTKFCAKNKNQIPQSLLNVLNLHDFDRETFIELTNKENLD